MGKSAGAGSIFHQITTYGGVKAPFKQAVLQSPAFIPRPLKSQNEYSFKTFLKFANVTTLAQARLLDTLCFNKQTSCLKVSLSTALSTSASA
jgi:carboxylesterase type B